MTQHSIQANEEIPMGSLVAICKGGMINPDQKVRSSAIELFISLYKKDKEYMLPVLNELP